MKLTGVSESFFVSNFQLSVLCKEQNYKVFIATVGQQCELTATN